MNRTFRIAAVLLGLAVLIVTCFAQNQTSKKVNAAFKKSGQKLSAATRKSEEKVGAAGKQGSKSVNRGVQRTSKRQGKGLDRRMKKHHHAKVVGHAVKHHRHSAKAKASTTK